MTVVLLELVRERLQMLWAGVERDVSPPSSYALVVRRRERREPRQRVDVRRLLLEDAVKERGRASPEPKLWIRLRLIVLGE